MPYAMSAIVSRAIPEIDGLKPSHRKLLYTMHTMGLSGAARTKSANVVGQTMKLNPHGDMAIYETMVRLTRGNGALLHPYVDSKGNFGKQYSKDMQFAAARYTEVKLEKIASELFGGIDEDTVDFMDNYDGRLKEPLLLPVSFPSVLVNMNQGIAVGMASNVASFNLREVCRAAAAYIDDAGADLMAIMPAPDLPSGGQLIYSEKAMAAIYETGRGTFRLRGKYRFDKRNSCIEVFEIPYTTTVEAIIDAIVELVRKGRIKDVSDVRDETDLNGLKIAIDIRKSADPDDLMRKLFRLTPLQDSFGCNFNILVNGRPRVMGVREIIKEWLAFRTSCVKRQLAHEMAGKRARLHLIEGLYKILVDIDKAIGIIRGTENDRDVVPNLMDGFGIDRAQADFICEIRLRNLNKAYILDKAGEIGALKGDVERIEQTLASERRLNSVIKKQLERVAKDYGKDRVTEIVHEDDVDEITDDHLIDDYNLKIFRTDQGYIKKIALTSLRSSGEHKLKEGDFCAQEVETHNKADLLLFTNMGNVCKMKAHELPESKASSMGEYLPNLLKLGEGERIVYVTATDEYDGHMLFGFRNGKFAKVGMDSYATKTNRRRLSNAYSTRSPLVYAVKLDGDVELAAFSNLDKALIFNTAAISAKTSRDSQGVQVMKEKKGSYVREVCGLEESGIRDLDYYRTKNIPAIGYYLKEGDYRKPEQLRF
ncbi:MAG: topoisomerase IV [Clostridiales bacterium]|jgi:DNA gyrase subunit A|nr:topoisomerase IV [Clostridiales bacterium]